MRRLVTVLAALLIGSAAGGIVLTGPASAAGACPKGTGVTVVVGSSVSCDRNGGGDAASNFADAGHSLTYVQRQPGAVCKVDGAPASAGCVNMPPADAYWGLFWSDGKSGRWTYASQGVGSLSIPTGGWVAFVFQSSDSKKSPGVTPVGAASSGTTRPSAGGGTSGSTRPSARPSATSSTPTPSATPTKKSDKKDKKDKKEKKEKKDDKRAKEPAATPSASSATQDGGVTDDATTETSAEVESGSGSGSLGWVAGLLGLLLLGGMGAVLWRRKAAGGTS